MPQPRDVIGNNGSYNRRRMHSDVNAFEIVGHGTTDTAFYGCPADLASTAQLINALTSDRNVDETGALRGTYEPQTDLLSLGQAHVGGTDLHDYDDAASGLSDLSSAGCRSDSASYTEQRAADRTARMPRKLEEEAAERLKQMRARATLGLHQDDEHDTSCDERDREDDDDVDHDDDLSSDAYNDEEDDHIPFRQHEHVPSAIAGEHGAVSGIAVPPVAESANAVPQSAADVDWGYLASVFTSSSSSSSASVTAPDSPPSMHDDHAQAATVPLALVRLPTSATTASPTHSSHTPIYGAIPWPSRPLRSTFGPGFDGSTDQLQLGGPAASPHGQPNRRRVYSSGSEFGTFVAPEAGEHAVALAAYYLQAAAAAVATANEQHQQATQQAVSIAAAADPSVLVTMDPAAHAHASQHTPISAFHFDPALLQQYMGYPEMGMWPVQQQLIEAQAPPLLGATTGPGTGSQLEGAHAGLVGQGPPATFAVNFPVPAASLSSASSQLASTFDNVFRTLSSVQQQADAMAAAPQADAQLPRPADLGDRPANSTVDASNAPPTTVQLHSAQGAARPGRSRSGTTESASSSQLSSIAQQSDFEQQEDTAEVDFVQTSSADVGSRLDDPTLTDQPRQQRDRRTSTTSVSNKGNNSSLSAHHSSRVGSVQHAKSNGTGSVGGAPSRSGDRLPFVVKRVPRGRRATDLNPAEPPSLPPVSIRSRSRSESQSSGRGFAVNDNEHDAHDGGGSGARIASRHASAIDTSLETAAVESPVAHRHGAGAADVDRSQASSLSVPSSRRLMVKSLPLSPEKPPSSTTGYSINGNRRHADGSVGRASASGAALDATATTGSTNGSIEWTALLPANHKLGASDGTRHLSSLTAAVDARYHLPQGYQPSLRLPLDCSQDLSSHELDHETVQREHTNQSTSSHFNEFAFRDYKEQYDSAVLDAARAAATVVQQQHTSLQSAKAVDSVASASLRLPSPFSSNAAVEIAIPVNKARHELAKARLMVSNALGLNGTNGARHDASMASDSSTVSRPPSLPISSTAPHSNWRPTLSPTYGQQSQFHASASAAAPMPSYPRPSLLGATSIPVSFPPPAPVTRQSTAPQPPPQMSSLQRSIALSLSMLPTESDIARVKGHLRPDGYYGDLFEGRQPGKDNSPFVSVAPSIGASGSAWEARAAASPSLQASILPSSSSPVQPSPRLEPGGAVSDPDIESRLASLYSEYLRAESRARAAAEMAKRLQLQHLNTSQIANGAGGSSKNRTADDAALSAHAAPGEVTAGSGEQTVGQHSEHHPKALSPSAAAKSGIARSIPTSPAHSRVTGVSPARSSFNSRRLNSAAAAVSSSVAMNITSDGAWGPPSNASTAPQHHHQQHGQGDAADRDQLDDGGGDDDTSAMLQSIGTLPSFAPSLRASAARGTSFNLQNMRSSLSSAETTAAVDAAAAVAEAARRQRLADARRSSIVAPSGQHPPSLHRNKSSSSSVASGTTSVNLHSRSSSSSSSRPPWHGTRYGDWIPTHWQPTFDHGRSPDSKAQQRHTRQVSADRTSLNSDGNGAFGSPARSSAGSTAAGQRVAEAVALKRSSGELAGSGPHWLGSTRSRPTSAASTLRSSSIGSATALIMANDTTDDRIVEADDSDTEDTSRAESSVDHGPGQQLQVDGQSRPGDGQDDGYRSSQDLGAIYGPRAGAAAAARAPLASKLQNGFAAGSRQRERLRIAREKALGHRGARA